MSHKTGSGDPRRKHAPDFGVDVFSVGDDVLRGKRGLSSMLRLGDDTRNKEVIEDGKRVLSWKLGSQDIALGPVAGWNIFPITVATDGSTGHLLLPDGTRNAPSVLSGMEAWSGEKRAVVERAGQYMTDIYARFGFYDTGFAWNQVGVTPDQDIFIAPPNTPSAVPEDQAQAWQRTVMGGLELLLQNDTPNRGLVDLFTQSLQRN
jgi:hypothetical protein